MNPGFQIGKEEMEISQNEKRKECAVYKMEYGIRKEYGICKEYMEYVRMVVKGRKCGSAQAASPFHPVSSTRYSHRFFQVKLFFKSSSFRTHACAPSGVEGLSVDLSPERRFEPRRAFRRRQPRIKSNEKLSR